MKDYKYHKKNRFFVKFPLKVSFKDFLVRNIFKKYDFSTKTMVIDITFALCDEWSDNTYLLESLNFMDIPIDDRCIHIGNTDSQGKASIIDSYRDCSIKDISFAPYDYKKSDTRCCQIKFVGCPYVAAVVTQQDEKVSLCCDPYNVNNDKKYTNE